MKGKRIFGVVLLLGLLLFVIRTQTRETETFAETEFEELMCRVESVSSLPDVYYTTVGKETILCEVAEELGIFEDYEMGSFRESRYSYTRLIKNGRYGTTSMNWMTLETEEGGFSTENYLHVSLEIPGNIGSALYYKEQLSGLLSSYKWPGEVNLELLGILRGKLSEKEEEKVQKTLLKSFEETVQIAFTYDEERDRTEVRLGLPFIRGDY